MCSCHSTDKANLDDDDDADHVVWSQVLKLYRRNDKLVAQNPNQEADRASMKTTRIRSVEGVVCVPNGLDPFLPTFEWRHNGPGEVKYMVS